MQAGGHRFESGYLHHSFQTTYRIPISQENPRFPLLGNALGNKWEVLPPGEQPQPLPRVQGSLRLAAFLLFALLACLLELFQHIAQA